MDVLAGIFAAALLQDLSYTSKTAFVSRGHRGLAVAAGACAILTSSVYLILAASVTMRSGLSLATGEAFAEALTAAERAEPSAACSGLTGWSCDWLEAGVTTTTENASSQAPRRWSHCEELSSGRRNPIDS